MRSEVGELIEFGLVCVITWPDSPGSGSSVIFGVESSFRVQTMVAIVPTKDGKRNILSRGCNWVRPSWT